MREKGALGGAYMSKDTSGRIAGMGVFVPIEFNIAAFAGGIILCSAEDPIVPTIG